MKPANYAWILQMLSALALGAALVWLPAWTWILMVPLGAIGTTFFSLLANFKSDVEIERVAPESEPTLAAWEHELTSLGFAPEPHSHRIAIAAPVVVRLWVHPDRSLVVLLGVLSGGTEYVEVSSDLTLGGDASPPHAPGLDTNPQPRSGILNPLVGHFVQSLNASGITELVAHHRAGLEALASRGIVVAPFRRGKFADDFRRDSAAKRAHLLRAPVRSSIRALYRIVTGTSPYTVPLAQQATWEAQLAEVERLRQGDLNGPPAQF